MWKIWVSLVTMAIAIGAAQVGADELEPIAIPLPFEVGRQLSAEDAAPIYDPDVEAQVNVLVVYTAAAQVWANGAGGIEGVVQEALDYAQLTADNSAVGIVFSVVGMVRTAYVESGDSTLDLQRITNAGDGYMDEVHGLRDEYAADLVVLLAYVQDVGGVGWLMGSAEGNSAYGFSLARVQQAAGSTFVHEMGHNFGLHHSKLQNFQPGPGVFSYAAGGRWIGSDGAGYCSVMTYTGGSYFVDGVSHWRVPVFSSPLLLHLGAPAGHVQDADNARTAREMKHVIAAYRREKGSLRVTIEPEKAMWRVVGTQEWYGSGYELALAVGVVKVEFNDVREWVIPKPVEVEIKEGEMTEVMVEYEMEVIKVEGGESGGGCFIGLLTLE